MTSSNYSLRTIVFFMEAMLEATGRTLSADHEPLETRESLRDRFRKLVRVLKRFSAEQESGWDWRSIQSGARFELDDRSCWAAPGGSCHDGSQSSPVFGQSRELSYAVAPGAWSDPSLAGWCAYRTGFESFPVSAPFAATGHVATLDVAMRVGLQGATAVYVAVMDLWSRRHDVAKSMTANKQPTRRRPAVDRLFLALMRFVSGFFGSHKMDARNNP